MKRLTRPLILIVLGFLTILLLLRLGDIDISMATLRQINPAYMLVAIVIHYSGFVMRGWRWQKLLAGLGHRLGYPYTTALLMSGWFVSALVPARLGDVARAYMLRRDHNVAMSQGLASIATERALDILAILTLALVAATWALAGRTPPWIWQTIAGGSIFFGLAAVVLLVTPQLETWFLNLLPWTLYQKLARFGFDMLVSIRRLGQNPTLLLTVAGQSLYIWLCDVFLMYFVFLSIGATAPLSVSAFTSMTVDLAAAVPIIPGALGQVEGTALGVLSIFDIGTQQSSLMILLNRFVSFWSFILVSGAITYFFGFSQALQPEQLRISNEQLTIIND
jgi:hypothetical protein